MRHEEAWRRLPDLLDDRDDPGLIDHVRACADCQRQLFLLGRVDRMLRDGASAQATARRARPTLARLVVAAAVAAAAAGLTLALVVPRHGRSHEFMLRTATGQLVGQAVMGHSDSRNVTLALTAHGMPIEHGHVFLLWAGDETSSMEVGRFMVDRSGGCRVRFNLPATHGWRRFWVTELGKKARVAST